MRNKRIEFYKHNLTYRDIRACVKVLQSLFLTTGKEVELFEKKFAHYLNVKYAVGLTSCTDALFLCLKYFGVKEGDEVITTPLSFIATANVIEYCGAKPVFVDVEETTGNIDAKLIEKAITKKTKAIIVVHLYGQLCDMKKLKSISKKYHIPLIEDSAHCIEGRRDSIQPGQLSDVACFSFYATKNITSGEGGAIATNNKKLYEWMLRARLHGMDKNAKDRYTKKYQHYDMDFLGYKANMTNIQASLLIHQLENIESFLQKKETYAQQYNTGFSKNSRVRTFSTLPNSKHARHLYPILVDPQKRDNYLKLLQENNIGIAVNFRSIHLMKYYREKYGYKPGNFPIAEHIGNSTISLPLYPKLKKEEINYIIKTVNAI